MSDVKIEIVKDDIVTISYTASNIHGALYLARIYSRSRDSDSIKITYLNKYYYRTCAFLLTIVCQVIIFQKIRVIYLKTEPNALHTVVHTTITHVSCIKKTKLIIIHT